MGLKWDLPGRREEFDHGGHFRRMQSVTVRGRGRVVSREEPIRLFDHEAFPETGPGSGLINVLVVDENVGYPDSSGVRCTIAVIYSAAWQAAKPTEREVSIA